MKHAHFAFGFSLMMLTMTHAAAQQTHATWVDEKRDDAKNYLNNTAHKMDKWFGKTNPNEPARASLRVMTDVHWNEYEGTTIKPRVRGKLQLPTLKNRLSVVFGDDDLDVENDGGIHNDERVIARTNRKFDKQQTREDNSSFGLRWSRLQENMGVNTDIDLGVRSDDVFVRVRMDKDWQLPHDVTARFEQMYRYGSKSEHYAVSTLDFSQPHSATGTLINRTQLAYTHKDVENLNWANSSYVQHDWQGKLGKKTFSYGVYVGGDIDDKKPALNVYGPYASYRQPVWRKWLFVQGDVSYYNDKTKDYNHHLGAFGRMEVVF